MDKSNEIRQIRVNHGNCGEESNKIENITKKTKCQFSERFLQIIWNEKILLPDLVCTDGTPLRIMSSGIWNNSAGPDFTHASLLFNGKLQNGPVEIHCLSSDWLRHGHDSSAAYDDVVLHVVWTDDLVNPVKPNLRTLELSKHILPSWNQLISDVDLAFYPFARKVPNGACAVRWALTDDTAVQHLLETAAMGRLSLKGQRLLRRSADVGQNQAIYEAVFEALGYKSNKIPFRMLAEQTPLSYLNKWSEMKIRKAILRGRAGVLPDMTQCEILDVFREEVSENWSIWWHEDGTHLDLVWSGGSTRPYNSRERRLEAGLLWLEQTNYAPADWLKHQACLLNSPRALRLALLDFPRGLPIWRSARDFCHDIRPPAALLGKERALDIVMNVFLPFLYAITESAPQQGLSQQTLKSIYLNLCLSQDNALLKQASQHFFIPPSRSQELLRKACHQQGLIDIYQNFCLALDNVCANCPFNASQG